MKYYKKCKGCGIDLQYSDVDKEGYVLNDEFSLCKKCFRSKNYGEFSNNLNTFYNIEEISEIKNDNVIMIIDILNPFETMIENINKYVDKDNLLLLINKIDIFPKSIKEQSIMEWIDKISQSKGISFKYALLVSATKKTNIDTIANFILGSDKKTSFIGYSNVGKSSIIKALFNSIDDNVDNLITNSIGTTKKIINLEFNEREINDYPGIILEGSYQNIMTIGELKKTNPLKEICVKNYQLGDKQTISIGDYAFFSIKNSINTNGYQFTFSNLIKLHRGKYKKNVSMKTFEIKGKAGKRYDLIISGLGIITFKYNGQELELQLPKDIKFNIVESLYG